MQEFTYVQDILDGIGFAINEEKNHEIIINYPLIFNKKNRKYSLSDDYQITSQPLGTFLTAFINTDFEKYNDFFDFFSKYSLSIIKCNKIKKLFNHSLFDAEAVHSIFTVIASKNKTQLLNLQEQIDMILDYCLVHPNKLAQNFKPIERMYALRRIDASFTILTSNKATFYSFPAFSSNSCKSEEEIYNFLSQKKSKISEVNLLLPNSLPVLLYRSLIAILTEQVHLRNCKNCGKYFISSSRLADYCNNLAPNSKKTCKQIGKFSTFKDNMQNNPALALYYKIYNRKLAMKLRYPDITKYSKDFDFFKTIGKAKLEKYKKRVLSSETFIKWLEKNS